MIRGIVPSGVLHIPATPGLAVALVAVLVGCSELPPVAVGLCGNGILEPLEDCDNPTSQCIQCRIVCTVDDPDTAIDETCRAGYACGADKFCHAPGGVFEQEPRSSLPFTVLGFRIVDVDFNGYGDVVGMNETAIAVRYGEPTGELLESYGVPTPQLTGVPALAGLVDESVADVVLPTADGLVAYTGAFGVPSPRQFPLGGSTGQNAGGRPNPVDAVPVKDTIAMFGRRSQSDPTLAVGIMKLSSHGPIFDASTASPCGATAPVDEQTWSQERVAHYGTPDATFIAFTHATTCVLVVRHLAPGSTVPRAEGTTCPPDGSTEGCRYVIESLTTTAFQKLTARPVFADLDGDGCPSLISQDSGVGALKEYAGTRDGVTNRCTIAPTPIALTALPDFQTSRLLASITLDPPVSGYSRDALVTSFGIYALEGAAVRTMYVSDRMMQGATVGDIDGDGATDVVLTTGQPNFDIARRVRGSPLFLRVRTPTEGSIHRTVIGDFDGDQRDDLAYVENLGPAQRLSIAYGTANGLAPGIQADAFARVAFMSAMQVRDSTDPFEVVDDLIVIDLVMRADGVVPEPEITILHGSPNRTMLSFYGPLLWTGDTTFRGVISGDFIGAGSRIDDLVAFQTTPKGTQIWRVPGLPGARLGAPLPLVSTPAPFDDEPLPRTQRIGDCPDDIAIDGLSPDFCLNKASFISWPTAFNAAGEVDHALILGVDVRVDPALQGTGVPHFLRFDPTQLTTDLVEALPAGAITPVPWQRTGGVVSGLEVVDLDHDGTPELVAAFADLPGQDGDTSDGYVMICRMSPQGVPGDCIDVADQVIDAGTVTGLRCGFATVGRVLPRCDAAEDARQLMVVCHDATRSYVVHIDGAAEGFRTPLRPALLDVPGRIRQVQFGDVTGDAVHDLVALDGTFGSSSLAVYPQLTSREHAVCVGE